ncbi:MAG: RNA polymerase sigma-G factor [Candidatus Melainabacteria bacterium HGW-Melainabacteria-1]|nr:MAG: RNA polymerase sigma-G factor [Candidatus Melainabacteria bacterium HGW-Melainabacteria-1]
MANPVKKTSTKVPLNPDQVVREYAPLVYKIAHSLSRRTVDPVEDLIQVGMIGLLEAQRRYDSEQPASFKTYATHFITGHIRHYLRDKQQLLKGPRSLQELAYRVQSTEKKLKQELDRDPSAAEVASQLGIDVASVEEANAYQQRMRMLWLDQQYSDGEQDSRTLLDTLPDEQSSLQGQMDTRIYIDEGIRQLPELDQQLLRLRYFQDLTQAAIAEQLSMSQMDVCRKLKQAEKRLRHILYEPA